MWLGVVDGVRAGRRVVSRPEWSERARAAVARHGRRGRRGALCSSGPEAQVRAGIGSGSGRGAPRP